MRNQSGYKLTASVTYLLLGGLLMLSASQSLLAQGKTDNAPDWFYPAWAAEAKYNQPIVVRDTESALGRYTQKTKEIGLKDLARIHGHLCDGLVIAFVEIKAVLKKLFPDDQAAHEAKIRQLRYEGKPASASDISKYEAMAGALSKKLLNTPPDNLLIITPKPVYKFRFNDLYDSRGDIINKDMPR